MTIFFFSWLQKIKKRFRYSFQFDPMSRVTRISTRKSGTICCFTLSNEWWFNTKLLRSSFISTLNIKINLIALCCVGSKLLTSEEIWICLHNFCTMLEFQSFAPFNFKPKFREKKNHNNPFIRKCMRSNVAKNI